MVTFSEQVESLSKTSQLRVNSFSGDVENTAISYSCNLTWISFNQYYERLFLHKLTLCIVWECQIILRLVTRRRPRSPEFPLVSSILSNLSISTSPGLIFICLMLKVNGRFLFNILYLREENVKSDLPVLPYGVNRCSGGCRHGGGRVTNQVEGFNKIVVKLDNI